MKQTMIKNACLSVISLTSRYNPCARFLSMKGFGIMRLLSVLVALACFLVVTGLFLTAATLVTVSSDRGAIAAAPARAFLSRPLNAPEVDRARKVVPRLYSLLRLLIFLFLFLAAIKLILLAGRAAGAARVYVGESVFRLARSLAKIRAEVSIRGYRGKHTRQPAAYFVSF